MLQAEATAKTRVLRQGFPWLGQTEELRTKPKPGCVAAMTALDFMLSNMESHWLRLIILDIGY
jgi:hypothetical protein